MKRVVLFAVLTAWSAATAFAQDLTADRIRCQLDPNCPKPGFRSLPFGNRGVTIDQPVVEDKPNAVSLYVTFAYDSAELQNDSVIILNALGKALTDPSLASARFMIAGHTDARGTNDYNQLLSERRANTVAQYLISEFAIDAARLEIEGFGEAELYDASRPDDQVNRRVQVVNLSAQGQ